MHYSSPGNPGNATGPAVNEPGYAQPKRAPFTKEDQRAVRKVLREFEQTAVNPPRRRPLLGDYWMPKKFHGPPAVAAKAKANVTRIKHTVAKKPAAKRQVAATRHAAPPQAAAQPPKLSRVWWLVPIALLSLIVLAPLGFGLSAWYRNRKAAREYLRTRGET